MWTLLLLACSAPVVLEGAPPADAEARWAQALAEVVTPAGRVRYERLQADPSALEAYVRAQAAPWPELTPAEALARKINTYNAAVLLGVLRQGVPASVQDVRVGLWRWGGAGFFKGLRFELDGRWVDLYDYEHEQLREAHRDPRIHAAISCASEGCPPLSAELYRAETLDAQLDAAVRRWLRTRAQVHAEVVELSAIMDWFRDDFIQWGQAESLCAWAARYDPRFAPPAADGCPHRFSAYDWSLNAARPPAPLVDPAALGPMLRWPYAASSCPPRMVALPGGRYTTGMRPPSPYGVVDTRGMARVDAPEARCPEALATSPGATACWVQTDLRDPVVPLHEVQVDPWCIEERPFPGEGPYSPDGLSTPDAALLDALLQSGRFGPRRLCTFTEYELAVAGPTQNLRFLYGDEATPRRCPDPEAAGIGERPRCFNPETGVMEYGAVISQWVVADAQFAAHACPEPPCLAAGGRPLVDAQGQPVVRYLVAGGTSRQQTRQAPYTPHTWHDHGDPGDGSGCDAWGWDDGPAICATPDARYTTCAADPSGPGCAELRLAEARWEALRRACVGTTMRACLSLALGEVYGDAIDSCPEGPPAPWGGG